MSIFARVSSIQEISSGTSALLIFLGLVGVLAVSGDGETLALLDKS